MGQQTQDSASAFHHPIHPPRQLGGQAFLYLDATSFEEARQSALRVLELAADCPRCKRVLHQLHERIGSTLFLDDDPRLLARAFDAADREGCAQSVLAACIVLFGRARVPAHAVH